MLSFTKMHLKVSSAKKMAVWECLEYVKCGDFFITLVVVIRFGIKPFKSIWNKYAHLSSVLFYTNRSKKIKIWSHDQTPVQWNTLHDTLLNVSLLFFTSNINGKMTLNVYNYNTVWPGHNTWPWNKWTPPYGTGKVSRVPFPTIAE